MNKKDEDALFKKLDELDPEKVGKGFMYLTIAAIILNVVVFFAAIAGVCWIVKYFFFT